MFIVERNSKMTSLSRRDFLRLAVAGSGALVVSQILSACGIEEAPQKIENRPNILAQTPEPTQVPPTPTEISTLGPTETLPSPTATIPEPSPTMTPVASPDLVVARNGDPETLVRRAIAAIGGMEKFVPKGADVVIKPNMCVGFRTYKFAATTNPWVVGTLVKLAFEAGASKVRVMDHTWRREMWEAYETSGIREQVEAAGGEMQFMELDDFVDTELPKARDVKSLKLYKDALNAQVLINVPIAKHHQDAKLTLGMKNLMGLMDNRLVIHKNIGQRLADLSTGIRPTLNVMDAVRMLMAFGPIGGALSDVKQMDTVVVSQDIVALDSYTATLFDMKPDDLDYVRAAVEMGLGRSDLDNLKIEEFSVS
jgi:uncharacterized protein (DUF362 family)